MMKEIWRAVPNYEGRYEVSSFGRVRVLDRTDAWGRFLDGKILAASNGNTKYRRVQLEAGGKREGKLVHRLVAEAFIGPPPTAHHHARHLDGNSLNNAFTNIAWGTAKDNAKDKELHGTARRGENSPTAKLSAKQVLAIVSRYREGSLMKDLASEYGVTLSNISCIILGKSWNSVTNIPKPRRK